MNINAVISAFASAFAKVFSIMQQTLFVFAGVDLNGNPYNFEISLFDLSLAMLLINLLLMAIMPFYDGGEDDD